MSDLIIKKCKTKKKGRGVFAGRRIKKGEVLEVCEIIPLTAKEVEAVENTILRQYYFERGKGGAVILGYASIYNHSDEPNAEFYWDDDKKRNRMLYEAIKTIKKGDEITVDYTGGNGFELWFDVND